LKDKLVSVIVPTYNRGCFIRETINSALNQTYQNFEIIIIDDGSTDNTKEIIKSFNDNRIKYVFQKHSGLPASSRNTGIKIAKGEYIAFLDSDDLWFPLKLEKQIKAIERNPDKLLISTNGIIFPSIFKIKFLSLNKDKEIFFKELLKKNIIINSSVLMKKNLVNKIGFLDENIILKSGEDHDYWLRILNYKDKSILILKDVLIKYRDHTQSRVSQYKKSNFFLRRYKKKAYIYKKYIDYDPTYLKKILKGILYQYKLSKLKEALFNKKISFSKFLKTKNIKPIDKILSLIDYFTNLIIFTGFAEKSIFLSNIIKYFKY